MYDFHKSRNDPNECSFYHKKFIQGKKHLLKCIKRKVNHFNNDNEEDNIQITLPQVNKHDKALDDLLKKQSVLEDKFNSLIVSSNELNKEKQERLNYEKNLQVVFLLLVNKYSKASSNTTHNNESNNIIFDCISNLDEDILNKLINKSLEIAGIDSKDIHFSFTEEASTSSNSKEINSDNQLFQLANSSRTNKKIDNCNQMNTKDREVFNLTDEVNSVTQCLMTTPTLSPPQASRRYSINEFHDIEMFPTSNQISIYDDLMF